jgi:cytokinin dehydrogenase
MSLDADLSRFEGGDVDAATRSFGRHDAARPRAVLRPRSVDEVVEIVRLARRHRLPLAARGQGHATGAQALVAGGIVVDMRALARVRAVGPDAAIVDGGATWRALLDATLAQGRRPPVLTDYQDLSVGGTLSAGGLGGASFRLGAQVDHVRALEIVTGAGELVRCSPTDERELFDAARAGLGQVGIITGAIVELVAAPAEVRSVRLRPRSIPEMLAALDAFAADDRVEHLYAQVEPDARAGWRARLTVTQDAAATPLEGASPTTVPFVELTRRADAFAAKAAAAPRANTWLDMFVPRAEAEAFLHGYLARPPCRCDILVFAARRSRFGAPLLRLPAGEEAVLIDILASAPAAEAGALRAKLAALPPAGATLYPVGSVLPDWPRHFGEAWEPFLRAKARFDPDGLLAPGCGIRPSAGGASGG